LERAIVMVAGMPGSGKSLASRHLESRGFRRVVMGDVVRGRLASRGVPVTPRTMMEEAKAIRAELGPAGVALLTIELVERLGLRPPLVVDGVRGLEEAAALARALSGCHSLLYVHASPQTRLRRLLARGREGDPKTPEEFFERDADEASFGLPLLSALADRVVVNEGPEELLRKQLDEILGEGLPCSGETILRYASLLARAGP